MEKNKAVFLDRDGTIIVDRDYPADVSQIEIISGAPDGLKKLKKAGYKLIIVTNQSGVARGYFDENHLKYFNDKVLELFEKEGAYIDETFYCPHLIDAVVEEYRVDCDCRKPKTGLFWRAVEKYDLDLSLCYAVGDRLRDVEICRESQCQGLLIGSHDGENVPNGTKIFNTFDECVNYILEDSVKN